MSVLEKYTRQELIAYYHELVFDDGRQIAAPTCGQYSDKPTMLRLIQELEAAGAHNVYILPEDPTEVGIV